MKFFEGGLFFNFWAWSWKVRQVALVFTTTVALSAIENCSFTSKPVKGLLQIFL